MAQGEQNKMVQGGPTAKNTLQTAEWVPNQGLPVGKYFGIGQVKPFSEHHARQNASFKYYLSLEKYKSLVKKFPQPPPQVYHQRTNCTKDPKRGEHGEKIGLIFFPPGIISGIIRRGTERGGGVNFPVSGRSENC